MLHRISSIVLVLVSIMIRKTLIDKAFLLWWRLCPNLLLLLLSLIYRHFERISILYRPLRQYFPYNKPCANFACVVDTSRTIAIKPKAVKAVDTYDL